MKSDIQRRSKVIVAFATAAVILCFYCHGVNAEPQSRAPSVSEMVAPTMVPVIDYLFDDDVGEAPTPPPVADGEVTVSSVDGLRAALADSNIGTINVLKGDYYVSTQSINGDGFYIGHNVIIKGSGDGAGRANFYARTDFLRALFRVAESVSVMFQNVGFFDTRVSYGSGESSNESGIRHEGADLIIFNCYFKENKNAILATMIGDVGGNLHVKGSTFLQNGDTQGAGQEHHIYFQGRSSTITHSRFVDSGYGHPIKTVVSEFSKVMNSVIDDADSKANHSINMEGGGDFTVTGNTITKGQQSENPYVFYLVTLRNGGRAGSITIADNTIHTGHPNTILLGNISDSVADISNNVLTGSFNTSNIVYSDAIFTGTTLNGVPLDGTDWRSTATQLTDNDDVRFLTGAGTYYLSSTPALAYEGLGGNDVLVASPNRAGAEVFFGGEGNDVLSGGKLQDFLFGGAGNDTIFAGAYTSWAFGGAGDDWLVSGPEGIAASIHYLMGGSGNDIVDARNTFKAHLDGGDNDDLLIGSDSHDDFNGGSGDDIVFGGGGAERYYYGGPGIDTMVYASNYGSDLKVDFDWGRVLRIRFIEGSDAGKTELGGGVETPYQFEFIQFANGVYDIAARSFSPGQVRQGADLSQILATPYPTHPENVSASASQKSP